MTAKFVGRMIGYGTSTTAAAFVLPHLFPVEIAATLIVTGALVTAIYLAAEDIERAIRGAT